jgi:hypothetical protein
LAWNGVRTGAKGGISGVTTVVWDAPNDVKIGGQAHLLARLQWVQRIPPLKAALFDERYSCRS